MALRTRKEIIKINDELIKQKQKIETEIYNNNWILENNDGIDGFCTTAICNTRLIDSIEPEEKEIIKNPYKWSIDIVLIKNEHNEIHVIRNGIHLAVFYLCDFSKIDIALEIIKESIPIISEINFAVLSTNYNRVPIVRKYPAIPFLIINNELFVKNSNKEKEYQNSIIGGSFFNYHIKTLKKEDIFSIEIKEGKWIIYLKNNATSPLHVYYETTVRNAERLARKHIFRNTIEIVYIRYDENLPHVIDFPYFFEVEYKNADRLREILGGENHYF